MDDNMYHNLQGRITILENNLEVAANLLAKDGKHLIHAMKFYREATGASLKAAKYHVEFIREGEKAKTETDDRLDLNPLLSNMTELDTILVDRLRKLEGYVEAMEDRLIDVEALEEAVRHIENDVEKLDIRVHDLEI